MQAPDLCENHRLPAQHLRKEHEIVLFFRGGSRLEAQKRCISFLLHGFHEKLESSEITPLSLSIYIYTDTPYIYISKR